MYFVFYGTDKPDHLQLRMDTRPAHVDWLMQQPVPIAGPRLDSEGNMIGSMVVCEVETLEDAKALFAQDPYAKAGLFGTTEISQWNWGIGKPE